MAREDNYTITPADQPMPRILYLKTTGGKIIFPTFELSIKNQLIIASIIEIIIIII